MYISYYDESGDDGYPKYSSEFFVLSCIYMHHRDWKTNYNKIVEFRRQLKEDYNFYIKQEFHCKQFLTDKSPYHGRYNDQERKEIYELYIKFIRVLDLKVINVVINKNNISNDRYSILENAFTYSIQRIENDLDGMSSESSFMIFCDKGRIGKMRKTSRKIQKINFIPSKMQPGTSYRKEIEKLIEDPIEKDSKESYFIQISDLIAYTVYLYSLRNFCTPPKQWANRICNVLDYGDEVNALDNLEEVLNLKASRKNKYGIVHYPE